MPELALGFVVGTSAMAAATILMGSNSLWSQEAAGWAQAIGTVGAIFGAVWIAGWQDRKVRQRNAEQQIKKAKSVAGYLAPILKMIEYDVKELKILTSQAHGGMSVEELRASGYQFRELPSFVSFVLENADLLPGEAIVSVPQLLSFRALIANDRELGYSLHLWSDGLISISRRLDWMKELIDDTYELLGELHDAPIADLLEQ